MTDQFDKRAKELLRSVPEAPDYSRQQFLRDLPQPYFERMTAADVGRHYRFLALLRREASPECAYQYHDGRAEYYIHRFDLARLRQILRGLRSGWGSTAAMLRLVAKPASSGSADEQEGAGDFILTGFYPVVSDDLPSSEQPVQKCEPPPWSQLRPFFVDQQGRVVRHLRVQSEAGSTGGTTLQILCINSSPHTVWRNVIETFECHDVFPSFVEAWLLRGGGENVQTMHHIEAVFPTGLADELVPSITRDLDRYLQIYIKPMSVLDIIGPAMMGPSSSHTAGANRIGRIARQVLLAMHDQGQIKKVERIEVTLLGSFRETGVGHRTPAAIGGGLRGLAADDERVMKVGQPAYMLEHPIELGSLRVAFGGYRRGSETQDARYQAVHNDNIAEIVAFTERGPLTITGFSLGGGNVEVRYVGERLSQPINGHRDVWLRGSQVSPINEDEPPLAGASRVVAIDKALRMPHPGYVMPFNSFEELLDYVEQDDLGLLAVVAEIERHLRGRSLEQVAHRLRQHWWVMKRAMKQGLERRTPSVLGCPGGDGWRLYEFVSAPGLFDNLYGRALSYATAIAEYNARSGLIVACPTAGSCGILPGILLAYEQLRNCSEDHLLDGLLIAGLMGMVFFDDVSTAGADFGCQAEVGAGAAMAASALTHLEGGNARQVIQAFVLAIKNCMGLICDPVAGLVEVPCIKRNGIYTSVAISAAAMALSGVQSFISPDEVIMAVREVGARLHRDYRETAGGGLAKTRDGKRAARHFRDEVQRWFTAQ